MSILNEKDVQKMCIHLLYGQTMYRLCTECIQCVNNNKECTFTRRAVCNLNLSGVDATALHVPSARHKKPRGHFKRSAAPSPLRVVNVYFYLLFIPQVFWLINDTCQWDVLSAPDDSWLDMGVICMEIGNLWVMSCLEIFVLDKIWMKLSKYFPHPLYTIQYIDIELKNN